MSTFIGTTLQELTVLCARLTSQCERLIILLLTIVVSKLSKLPSARQQDVFNVALFPTLCDATNSYSQSYGLKHVRSSDTADSCMWHSYRLHTVTEYCQTCLQAMRCSGK